MENETKDKAPGQGGNEQPEKKPMKSLVFDLRWHDSIKQLPQYERLEMYEAICDYAKDGTELNTVDSLKRMALRMVYDQIDDQRRFLKDAEEL